jgi:hypothetical protein
MNQVPAETGFSHHYKAGRWTPRRTALQQRRQKGKNGFATGFYGKYLFYKICSLLALIPPSN